MKKILFVIVVLFCFQISVIGQTAAGLIPATANVYISSSNVDKFLKTLTFFAENFGSKLQKNDLKSFKENFKKNTGIDISSEFSLKNAGIDSTKGLSFASYENNIRGEKRFLFLFPVLDLANSPLRFVEILKAMNKNENLDLNPIISSYRGRAIFQIGSDIFLTSIDDYLIISSSGELSHKVIDVEMGSCASLLYEKDYMDSKNNLKKNSDFHGFIRTKFLENQLLNNQSEFCKIIKETKFYGFSFDLDLIANKILIDLNVAFSERKFISLFSSKKRKDVHIYKLKNFPAYLVLNKKKIKKLSVKMKKILSEKFQLVSYSKIPYGKFKKNLFLYLNSKDFLNFFKKSSSMYRHFDSTKSIFIVGKKIDNKLNFKLNLFFDKTFNGKVKLLKKRKI